MLADETTIMLKVLLCAALMYILGRERQRKGRFIGPRTLILLGCATTLLSAISVAIENYFVLGGIITGVGFLCSGVIVKREEMIGGLTTAALVWLAAIIGITVGLDLYVTSAFTTIFSYVVLRSKSEKDVD